jgi:hypothetical protein
MTAYLQNVLDFVGLHPSLAIASAFLVSLCEALPIIGLFAPSGVVLAPGFHAKPGKKSTLMRERATPSSFNIR